MLPVLGGEVNGFVGTKMLLTDVYRIPVGVSLGVIALVLAGAVAASWLRARSARERLARRVRDGDDGGMLQAPLH